MDSSSYAAITSSPTSSSPLSSSLHEVLLRKEQCVGSVRSRSSRAKGNLPASSDTRSELRRRGGKFVSELRSTVLPHHSSAAAAADGDEGRRPTGTHQGSISCPPYPPLPPAYQDLLHEPRQEHQLLRSEVRDDSRPIRQVMTMTMPAAPDGHESLMTMPAPIDDYWAPALHSDPEPPTSAAAADADGSCPIISSPADCYCCSSSSSSSSQAELVPHCCPPPAATTAHPSTISSSGPSFRNHHSRRPTAKPLELSSPRHKGRLAGRNEESREYFLAKLKRLIEKADSHAVLRRDEAGEPTSPISKCGRRRYLDPLLSRSDSQLIVAKISAANWFGIENNYCANTTMAAGRYHHHYHDDSSRFSRPPRELFHQEREPMAMRRDDNCGAGVSAADAEVEKLSRRADALMLSSSAAPARASTAQSSNMSQPDNKRNIRGSITAEPSPHRRQQMLMSPQVFSLEALNSSFAAEKGDEQQSRGSSYDESDEASRVMSQTRYSERYASHHVIKPNNSLSTDGQLFENMKVGHLLPSASRSQPTRLHQSRVGPPSRRQHRPPVVAYQRGAATIAGSKLPGKSEAFEAFVMDAWHPGTPDAALGALQDRVESLAVGKRCRMETEIWNFDPKPQTPITATGERVVRSSWKEPLDQNGQPLRLISGLDAGCERTECNSGFGSDGDDSSGDDSGILDDDSNMSFGCSASGTSLRGY